MLKCKEVARLVSESMDRKLGLWQRMNLWLHLSMCRLCAAFSRDIDFLRRASAQMDEQAGEEPGDVTLPQPARERIKEALRK